MGHNDERFAKLRGLIRERYGKEASLARAIGMNPSTLSKLLNGGRQWRGDEIATVCQALGIPLSEAYLYKFF